MSQYRTLALLFSILSLTSCATPDDPRSRWRVGGGPPATVSGKAFVFGPSGGATLEGASLFVAEAPEIATTIGADGTFSLDVPSGAPISLVVRQPGFHDTQAATLALDAAGLDSVGFQVPTESIFDLMATFIDYSPDPTRCQIASTVSRAGTAPYGGSGLGEPGVVVSIDPPMPAENGPIYFQYVSDTYIYPDRALTETSIDGGVLFVNVPPGEYTMRAEKIGKSFTEVTLRCREGFLVNAAPPRGLQEL